MAGTNSLLIFMFTLIMVVQSCWSSTELSNLTDFSALVAFKAGMASNNILSRKWNSTTSFCNWMGVSCTSPPLQRISALRLRAMGLQGTISPHIANLSFLLVLDLSSNHLHGPLPSGLGRLHRLQELNVSRNNVEGIIPPSISRCRDLRGLYLSDNMFVGSIPQQLGFLSMLRVLRLNDNNLTGNIHPALGNLSKLELLALHENELEGAIPDEIAGNLLGLATLILRGNLFTGSIPASIFNISALRVADISINGLSGHLPSVYLPNLVQLFLDGNRFSGPIPVSLSNATQLEFLLLSQNGLQGSMPHEISSLVHLKSLQAEENELSGVIPQSIFNMSSLTWLQLRSNSFHGPIPHDVGVGLPNLQDFFLSHNHLNGPLPASISNASKIIYLEVSGNTFSGPVPTTLGHLTQLQSLNLGYNQFTNEPNKAELSFLSPLQNCRDLTHLVIDFNPLNGVLPDSISNISTTLKAFVGGSCGIKGRIPPGLGNFSSLYHLSLDHNELSGVIPATVGGMSDLVRLNLTGNRIEGPIPAELCRLGQLGELNLDENRLSGSIPECILNLTALRIVSLAANRLSSTIPSRFWDFRDFLYVNLSKNNLQGSLSPELGNLRALYSIDLSSNSLSGEIPVTLGNIQTLLYMDLAANSFRGSVPRSFSQLVIIQHLDLSSNALSGMIPKTLAELRDLKYLNLSYNRLEGEIPSGGVFMNLTDQSFVGNLALCGPPRLHVPVCPIHASDSRDHNRRTLILKISIPIISTIILVIVCFSILIFWKSKKVKMVASTHQSLEVQHLRRITYYELQRATRNFSPDCLLGFGSSSSVYRGTLADGTDVAVKVLNLQVEGSAKIFDAECNVMCNVRHRNLVKVITACSNPDFKALVLEFMSNGSLEMWLRSGDNNLNLLKRLEILINVGSAMEYLHHESSVPIVHCDLKPSNVLLDDDMMAHVGDFGIAKLLAEEDKPTAQTQTLGTIGYIAPEYGLDGRVSPSTDVYSYGILVLETLTGKKPTDEMFRGGSLHRWVDDAFPEQVAEVVDGNLLHELEGARGVDNKNSLNEPVQQLLVPIFHVGLLCSVESPDQRITMRDAVSRLKKIRKKFGHH